MACSCQKNRVQYEVVADDGKGKVLYGPISSEATCQAVSKRYPGSVVRKKGKSGAAVAK